jgi:uncharacterized SAM-binding protein YcdF (DUF218 family)
MNRVWRHISHWLARGAVAFTTLFFVVNSGLLLGPWTRALSAPWSEEPRKGTLIILGGDAIADSIPGVNSYWRCVYAVYEWRRGNYNALVISGGGGLAEAMRNIVIAEGIPPAAVKVETRARTTRENAIFVAEMLRDTPGAKILLTSDYHSRRAWGAFQRAGVNVIPRPFPDAAKRSGDWRGRWPVFLEVVQETGKLWWYHWNRWV